MYFNIWTCVLFLYLRVTSTNNLAFISLDPEQARQNARPDLDANCMAL